MKYGVLRSIVSAQPQWRFLRDFKADIKYRRRTEAASLNTSSRRARICVEDVEVHKAAARVMSLQMTDSWNLLEAWNQLLLPYLQ